MSADVVVNDRKWFEIADDFSAYEETLAMLQAQYDALPQTAEYQERHELATEMAQVRERREELARELAAKTDAFCFVDQRAEVEIEALKDRVRKLKAKLDAYEAGREWLREYMLKSMQAQKLPHLKTAEHTVFVREGQGAGVVTDIDKLGPEYKSAEIKMPLDLWQRIYETAIEHSPPELAQQIMDIRIRVEPMPSAIKRAIKQGVDVEGGDIAFNPHLVIL